MRTPLELVVRPFVVTDFTNPQQPAVPTDTSNTPDDIVLDFGSDSVTMWSGNFEQTVSFYFIKKPKEKKKPSADPINPFAPPA